MTGMSADRSVGLWDGAICVTPPGLGSRGGRPTSFDRARYSPRNEVERTVNALKGFRSVATRYDKRAYVFHGTVTLAAIRLWLR
ncbi:hypothetical protein GCM10010278_70500 [Streptomyces melanogenes]|nr:hypothetical protein GCM10010278_70500 [Streptomyces melanogenes]